MFEFENATLNGSLIEAIELDDCDVRIHFSGTEEAFEWSYETEDIAKSKYVEATTAWRGECHAPPLPK